MAYQELLNSTHSYFFIITQNENRFARQYHFIRQEEGTFFTLLRTTRKSSILPSLLPDEGVPHGPEPLSLSSRRYRLGAEPYGTERRVEGSQHGLDDNTGC